MASRTSFTDPSLADLREAYLEEDLLVFAGAGLHDAADETPAVAIGIAALSPRLRGVFSARREPALERVFALIWPAFPALTGEILRRRHYLLGEADRLFDEPKLQTAFHALFHGSPILFVGYGLADDDFDQVLARVRVFAGEQPPRHFALIAEETISPHRRARIEESGVQIIPYSNADGKHGEVVRILDWLAGS